MTLVISWYLQPQRTPINICMKRGTVCPIFKLKALGKPVIEKMKSQSHAIA
jgi:hypothetical protein